MFHGVRYSLLYRKVRRKYDEDMPRSLDFILAKGQIGDWFVLYQLSKNCNPYFFREFVRELARELRVKPKKTKDGKEKKSKELEMTKDAELGENFDKNEDDTDSSDSDSEEGSNK